MEKWELAYDDYLAGMKYKDIAIKYEVTIDVVKKWKARKWCQKTGKAEGAKGAKVPSQKQKVPVRKENRGAAKRNQNATVTGLYAKWLPEEITEILGVTPKDPLDVLWHNIQLQQAKIIRSFKLQAVKDKNDLTTRVISSGDSGDVYQYREAFEKDNAFLQGISKAMNTLTTMITQYEKLLHADPALDTELRRAQLEKLKAETASINADVEGVEGSAVQIIDDIPEAVPDDGSKVD